MPEPSPQPELPLPEAQPRASDAPAPPVPPHRVEVWFNHLENWIQLESFLTTPERRISRVRIRCTGLKELTWEIYDDALALEGTVRSKIHRSSIRAQIDRLYAAVPLRTATVLFFSRMRPLGEKETVQPVPIPATYARRYLEEQIWQMGASLAGQFTLHGQVLTAAREQAHAEDEAVLQQIPEADRPLIRAFMEKDLRRAERKNLRAAIEQARLAQAGRDRAAAQERRERARRLRELRRAIRQPGGAETLFRRPAILAPAPSAPRAPVPPVPTRIEPPALEVQETLLALEDLSGYLLREWAVQWWTSNQADDLLAVPYCNLQRLEYQIRTALRVIGPLRGRALLCDEVGLGKTIEAGLVLKEYLTRGMVRQFLVLTVPSLVDQWEEELADKFSLPVATTNQAVFRQDPTAFWRDQNGIVASLHTLKQPAHLAVAQTRNWDLLIVDEAHYLRNRASQAWQAVNALPRQHLLLLTATPVQNSLEDLYHLVTLLQPGQFPSPKEFRARFVDARRPHHPKDPEELRRLLNQVMIRNTRANAGLQLPSRRAETVLFQAEPAERDFWESWEREFRIQLGELPASQASLWGRLLLQTAGSSSVAWQEALRSFPRKAWAAQWIKDVPLESSLRRKCELLRPLTQAEGGLVVFSQFLKTQAALAQQLGALGIPAFVINGQTPPPARQPITDEFRKRGGVLLLTHSGTEGRNLQFCHQLVNFDLPWNPMEIEQRIGRLHRLGQQRTVRIYNFVEAGTLQEHLLHVLQEKLNLFELVVGETGLILGERYGSDEFAEEILRRWRESEGRVGQALEALGNELAAARESFAQVKQLDDTLFAHDYESL